MYNSTNINTNTKPTFINAKPIISAIVIASSEIKNIIFNLEKDDLILALSEIFLSSIYTFSTNCLGGSNNRFAKCDSSSSVMNTAGMCCSLGLAILSLILNIDLTYTLYAELHILSNEL